MEISQAQSGAVLASMKEFISVDYNGNLRWELTGKDVKCSFFVKLSTFDAEFGHLML